MQKALVGKSKNWVGVFILLILAAVITGSNGWSKVNFQPSFITMESWAPYYRPFEAVVQTSMPIQWVNATASSHTVRHDGCLGGGPCLFNSGAVPPNGRYSIPGLPPGRYTYHCELHPIMQGELIVEDKVINMTKSK